jgi:hypothetical protein
VQPGQYHRPHRLAVLFSHRTLESLTRNDTRFRLQHPFHNDTLPLLPQSTIQSTSIFVSVQTKRYRVVTTTTLLVGLPTPGRCLPTQVNCG